MVDQRSGRGLKSLIQYLFAFVFLAALTVHAAETGAHHIVLLGDPHLPGPNLDVKKKVLETVNAWSDVEMVVALGDICEESGSDEEYAAAREFFAGLNKPFVPIPGNHDFIYSWFRKGVKSVRSAPWTRDAKLRTFMETFGLQDLYHSKSVGDYSLIFLAPDSLGYLTEISSKQVEWLRAELERNKTRPTIVFFHAPLEGTLRTYSKNTNAPDFIAQPAATIRELLSANPQVFLWVSGHTHTPPTEESFASAINVYDGRVTNIHNTDMQDRKTIWTNSLLLYPDKVVVRTYNHAKSVWFTGVERTISRPAN